MWLREEVMHLDLRYSLVRLLTNLLPPLAFNRVRTVLLVQAGLTIGTGTVVGGNLTVVGDGRPARNVHIGAHSFINGGCTFDASAQITIGSNVALGQGVMILTNTHEVGPASRRAGKLRTLPVFIGNGAWIGARATILPGVVIAPGAVVAAGAVVNRDVEADSMVAGVPTHTVKYLAKSSVRQLA